jgi:hypothetical protein
VAPGLTASGPLFFPPFLPLPPEPADPPVPDLPAKPLAADRAPPAEAPVPRREGVSAKEVVRLLAVSDRVAPPSAEGEEGDALPFPPLPTPPPLKKLSMAMKTCRP